MLGRLQDGLFRPVDVASLAVFRVLFGAIMLWEAARYYAYDWIGHYSLPSIMFKYYGFGWVQPWPGEGLYWHFGGLAVLAILIMIGAFYRLAMILFFFAFTYVFLLDQANYLNHLYLVCVVSALMCVLPANRAFSVDARLWPLGRGDTVPAWSVWALRIQFEIMLVYAGLVKLNPDWLALQPLESWLGNKAELPVLGLLYSQQWVIAIAAYGVIALHLIGAPLLFWRRARRYVFVVYVCFHVSNHFTFSIGIFPWFTIAGTLMFFDPAWPRQLWRWLGRSRDSDNARGIERANVLADSRERRRGPAPMAHQKFLVLGGLAIWFAVQSLMPLRHYLYPGDVNWTEEGYRFSWRMMLRSKPSTAIFFVTDPKTGKTWQVDPRSYLYPKQNRKMPMQPDMILQFAHHLATTWEQKYEIPNVEVRATVRAALNGREPKLLVDPRRDLTKERRTLDHVDWLMPFPGPLVDTGK
jgi:vitamin K-dependent gamma-carboxylase